MYVQYVCHAYSDQLPITGTINFIFSKGMCLDPEGGEYAFKF